MHTLCCTCAALCRLVICCPVLRTQPAACNLLAMLQVAVKGRGHDLPLVAPVQDDMAGQGQQQQQQFVVAPQVIPHTSLLLWHAGSCLHCSAPVCTEPEAFMRAASSATHHWLLQATPDNLAFKPDAGPVCCAPAPSKAQGKQSRLGAVQAAGKSHGQGAAGWTPAGPPAVLRLLQVLALSTASPGCGLDAVCSMPAMAAAIKVRRSAPEFCGSHCLSLSCLAVQHCALASTTCCRQLPHPRRQQAPIRRCVVSGVVVAPVDHLCVPAGSCSGYHTGPL